MFLRKEALIYITTLERSRQDLNIPNAHIFHNNLDSSDYTIPSWGTVEEIGENFCDLVIFLIQKS